MADAGSLRSAQDRWGLVRDKYAPLPPVRQKANYYGPWHDDYWRKVRLYFVPYILSAQLASEKPLSPAQFVEAFSASSCTWASGSRPLSSTSCSPRNTSRARAPPCTVQVLALVTVLIATAVIIVVIGMHLCMGSWNDAALASRTACSRPSSAAPSRALRGSRRTLPCSSWRSPLPAHRRSAGRQRRRGQCAQPRGGPSRAQALWRDAHAAQPPLQGARRRDGLRCGALSGCVCVSK